MSFLISFIKLVSLVSKGDFMGHKRFGGKQYGRRPGGKKRGGRRIRSYGVSRGGIRL